MADGVRSIMNFIRNMQLAVDLIYLNRLKFIRHLMIRHFERVIS